MCNRLTVGDTIHYRMWSGEIVTAQVLGIELCKEGEKSGRSVNSANLDSHRNIVLDLSNNHWAYGTQVQQIKKKKNG